MAEIKITPMIRQYLRIKEQHQDAILFFRLGDFYEMFFEDAEKASRILDIALTSRNRDGEGAVPLCGVPYHAALPYVAKLIRAGHKVAICEQVEDPKLAQGVVQRSVVRVITPGTVVEGEGIEAQENNFLAAAVRDGDGLGLAVADVTTGEFRFTRVADETELAEELGRIGPREVVLAGDDKRLEETLRREFPDLHLSGLRWNRPGSSSQRLAELGLWDGHADDEWKAGLAAAGTVVSFLEETLPAGVKGLGRLRWYSCAAYLTLDGKTRNNLELVSSFEGRKSGSLLQVVDYTVTPMGGRAIRQWLLYPLMNEAEIRRRHDAVEELIADFGRRRDLAAGLREVQDLERLAGRVVSGNAQPRDLAAIRTSLLAIDPIARLLDKCRTDLLAAARANLWTSPEIVELIGRAIVDNPPAQVKDGGVIRTGFCPELDEIREGRSYAKQWVARFESEERRRTGIASLKVRYNRVFGYYIEVTKSNLQSVPPSYIRKQTLVGAERFITPELKEYEARILNSDEEIAKIEQKLFAEVCDEIAGHHSQMKEASRALATVDVLAALAEAAHTRHFVRPRVHSGRVISIREGRHPVVEAALGRGGFVPNDCLLDPDTQQIVLLTGPNMAGKSTYMRQVALLVILAQMGSFVPAGEAEIGLVDRIFTRIGAADALARGESTFMVEMRETAQILRHVTDRSLIILDEVGRGTSTFDGISIAWSVAEHLHDMSARPRTLFATHYHELVDLAASRNRVKNFSFAVKEWKEDIIFLRTLVRGGANRSYGIHVGRLAGLPPAVIERAREILRSLEMGGGDKEKAVAKGALPARPAQMTLFTRKENF